MGEAMMKMNIGIILIMTLDPQILFNHGYNPLISVRFREGSIVQPRFPAPLSNRAHTLARLMDVLQGTLAQQNPELATAAACGSSPHMLFSGRDDEDEFFFFFEINYGGIPGRPLGDGFDVHAWWPNFTSIPVEYAENYFPLRISRLRARRDSGGAGLHRGGNGLEKVYTFLAAGEVSIHDDRTRSRPWGIGGGEAAEPSRKVLLRSDGKEVEVPSKVDALCVEAGDRLLYLTAGGGGWGDPLLRDPDRVRADVVRDLVSREKARASYGVVLGADGSVDVRETETLREELRAQRPAALPTFDFGPEHAATGMRA
jgi:N-methylhydantoinase B